MVEGGAADVVVDDRRPFRGFLGPFAIELGVEDGFDGAEGTGADDEGALAGRFHPLARKASYELHDAATGAVALLRVPLFAQDDLDEDSRMWPDLGGLALDALGRPVGVAPMARGHVLGQGRVPTVGRTAPVHGDALAAMEHLDRGRGVADPQLLSYQRVRHRVVVLVDLHVVVDAGAALLPVREHVVLGRKHLERGALRVLKEGGGSCPEMTRPGFFYPLGPLGKGGFDPGEGKNLPFTDFCYPPWGCVLAPRLYLRFVLWAFRTCRDNCRVVML